MPESIQPEAGTTPDQFAALLDLEANADWPSLEVGVSAALQRGGLRPQQRAQLLQLQAAALRHQGQSKPAETVLFESLGLDCSPAPALEWLHLQWPRLASDQADPHWLSVCQTLVDQGHTAALIRGLMAALGKLPLQAQRQTLLDTIERSNALQLSAGSSWERQWILLKRAAPAGGMGFWG